MKLPLTEDSDPDQLNYSDAIVTNEKGTPYCIYVDICLLSILLCDA